MRQLADLTMDGPRGASSGSGEQISDGWDNGF
jgi:hypothetical protein